MYYVEIAYCDQDKGFVFGYKTKAQSIQSLYQELNLTISNITVGINGEIVDWDYWIDKKCRIEFYPELRVDPIEKRKRLVAAKRKRLQK